jgi:hypothetical protein
MTARTASVASQVPGMQHQHAETAAQELDVKSGRQNSVKPTSAAQRRANPAWLRSQIADFMARHDRALGKAKRDELLGIVEGVERGGGE